ncbi:hypothetical protein D3C72_2550380 [compost metagenome]
MTCAGEPTQSPTAAKYTATQTIAARITQRRIRAPSPTAVKPSRRPENVSWAVGDNG